MQVESYKLTMRPEAGGVLEDACLVYAQWGRLNAARDNVVLLPSYYSGKHESYAPLIGPGRALDPEHYFIVAPNMFGNGVSTSPSHMARLDLFPAISIGDNVRAQHELLQHLGVTRIALAAGWSMGAMQALHWAMLYPDYVRSVVAVCGTAVCWPINSVFLEGLAMILEAACGPAPYLAEDKALAMFGRAYAGWAYSAPFFRGALCPASGGMPASKPCSMIRGRQIKTTAPPTCFPCCARGQGRPWTTTARSPHTHHRALHDRAERY